MGSADFGWCYGENARTGGRQDLPSRAVGVSAAIANAVFHATGARVRDLPITIERLLKPAGAD